MVICCFIEGDPEAVSTGCAHAFDIDLKGARRICSSVNVQESRLGTEIRDDACYVAGPRNGERTL
jgi:hypothetical protein